MKNMKLLFQEFLLITVAINIVFALIGVYNHFTGGEDSFSWYTYLSVLACAFANTFPSWLFLDDEKAFPTPYIRLLLHFICTYGISSLFGFSCGWYSEWKSFLIWTFCFVFVYVFVWVFMIYLSRQDEKKINKALDFVRDEE